MKRQHLASLVAALTLLSACPSDNDPTGPSTTVSSVAVTGATTLTAIGQSVQLIATATLSDGTTEVVTTSASWQSLSPTVAIVSADGRVSAVTAGSATISATYRGRSGSTTVPVSFAVHTQSTMRGVIDGLLWVAVAVSSARGVATPNNPAGILSVGGAEAFTGPYTSITIGVPAVVGSYTIGPNAVANAQLQIPNSTSTWIAGAGGGSGFITVDTLSPTNASGTFTLTLVPLGGTNATGNRVLSSGVFAVTF